MFKLAMIQMQVQGGRKKTNLTHARYLIDEAAGNGARLMVLPEAFDLGWTHPAALREASAIPDGDVCLMLAEAARENEIFVCAGMVEQSTDKIYNSAVLIDPTGKVILKHRKLNELAIGHKYYKQGDRLNVCHTELGTLGLMICADGFAKDQVLSRALCYMGADIILSPSAWALPSDHQPDAGPFQSCVNEWRQVYQPVAQDYSVYIVGVSNVGSIAAGPWAGKNCIGCSLLIGPDGREMLQGPYGPQAEMIMYADIEPLPRPARGTDWVDRHKH
ncbi:MAG: carbon-nitrogen hydrolase family protein [Candidatus Neomarinimicrobiota bacterium]